MDTLNLKDGLNFWYIFLQSDLRRPCDVTYKMYHIVFCPESTLELTIVGSFSLWDIFSVRPKRSQITKFMGPTRGPPGSYRTQMGPMLAPWSLLSGMLRTIVVSKQGGGGIKWWPIPYSNFLFYSKNIFFGWTIVDQISWYLITTHLPFTQTSKSKWWGG